LKVHEGSGRVRHQRLFRPTHPLPLYEEILTGFLRFAWTPMQGSSGASRPPDPPGQLRRWSMSSCSTQRRHTYSRLCVLPCSYRICKLPIRRQRTRMRHGARVAKLMVDYKSTTKRRHAFGIHLPQVARNRRGMQRRRGTDAPAESLSSGPSAIK